MYQHVLTSSLGKTPLVEFFGPSGRLHGGRLGKYAIFPSPGAERIKILPHLRHEITGSRRYEKQGRWKRSGLREGRRYSRRCIEQDAGVFILFIC